MTRLMENLEHSITVFLSSLVIMKPLLNVNICIGLNKSMAFLKVSFCVWVYMCSGFRRGGETAENNSWIQLNNLFNNRGSCLSHTTDTAQEGILISPESALKLRSIQIYSQT